MMVTYHPNNLWYTRKVGKVLRSKSLVLLLALSSCAPNWSKKDAIGQAAVLAITTVDWWQTHQITDNCTEVNPIIGKCGQRMDVDLYFMGVMMISVIVADRLPPHWRDVFQGAWIGAEAATVINNAL